MNTLITVPDGGIVDTELEAMSRRYELDEAVFLQDQAVFAKHLLAVSPTESDAARAAFEERQRSKLAKLAKQLDNLNNLKNTRRKARVVAESAETPVDVAGK